MKLTAQQLRQFDDQGYCFFPNCFAEEEIALMRSGADEILGQQREEVWREMGRPAKEPRSDSTPSKWRRLCDRMSRRPSRVRVGKIDSA